MLKRGSTAVRRALYAFATNEAVFVFALFVVYGVLTMKPFILYKEAIVQIERYVMIPWGMALCLLRLERQASMKDKPLRWDIVVLFVLLMWIVVPFGLRFGLTADNVFSWHSWTVVLFGVYALTSEGTAVHREKLLDICSALFAVLSFVLGSLLLYCAVTVTEYSPYNFGVYNSTQNSAQLLLGMHHNSSGILALSCAIMSFMGAVRRRGILARMAHLIPAVMMGIVVVLTQSRTTRYCLIAVIALGCWGVAASGRRIRHAALRHAAGLALCAVVVVAGYMAADWLTNSALDHYAHVNMKRAQAYQLEAGDVQETDIPSETADVDSYRQEARGGMNLSFTGRPTIWKNTINLFRSMPKYLVIGFGVGRVSTQLMDARTMELEGWVMLTTHNTFLQFVADYGLIGFVLMAAFLAMMVLPCIRVFFAAGQKPGYRVLCGMVISGLLTGMMESVTLTAMHPLNILTFFAFALIVARDREMRSLV